MEVQNTIKYFRCLPVIILYFVIDLSLMFSSPLSFTAAVLNKGLHVSSSVTQELCVSCSTENAYLKKGN